MREISPLRLLSLSLSYSFLPPSLPPQCFRSGNFALFKDRRLIHSQNNDGHLLSCMDRYRTFVTFLKKTRRTSTTRLVPFHDWVPPFACELAISSSQHSAFIPLKLNLLNMYVKLRDATEISISFSYSRSPSSKRHASRTLSRAPSGRSVMPHAKF